MKRCEPLRACGPSQARKGDVRVKRARLTRKAHALAFFFETTMKPRERAGIIRHAEP